MVNTLELEHSPLGTLVPTVEEQFAFVPSPVPEQITLSPSLIFALDKASRAIATLAGVGETTPNPHLLIRPFLKREAVLSSRIEGTQASISDLFLFEASGEKQEHEDVREVANYVYALEKGLVLLEELPICVRMANEVHGVLMTRVRGENKRPGELRDGQVWIGPRGTPIQDARYIPPPSSFIPDLLADWEKYANSDVEIPPLIQCGVLHYQFEAIHPYPDGNGRLGRLLITLFLCAKKVLPVPLLYLSAYFERKRTEYYDHLLQVSTTGDWEPWLRFFLEGVEEQALDAVERLRKIRDLHEQYKTTLQAFNASGNALRLLDELFANPYMTVPTASRILGITPQGARGVLDKLTKGRIVQFYSGTWPRFVVARELLALIDAPLVKANSPE